MFWLIKHGTTVSILLFDMREIVWKYQRAMFSWKFFHRCLNSASFPTKRLMIWELEIVVYDSTVFKTLKFSQNKWQVVETLDVCEECLLMLWICITNWSGACQQNNCVARYLYSFMFKIQGIQFVPQGTLLKI